MQARLDLTCECGRGFRIKPEQAKKMRCHFCGASLATATTAQPELEQKAAPDPIAVSCEHCDHALQVPAEHAGKRVRCPACKEPVRIPGGRPESRSVQPRRRSSRRVAAAAQARQSFPHVLALSAGFAVSFGGALVLGFLAGILLALVAGGTPVRMHELSAELLIFVLGITLACSMAGSYLAGRIAGFDYHAHAMTVAVLHALAGIGLEVVLASAMFAGKIDFFSILSGGLIVLLGGMLGGWAAAAYPGEQKEQTSSLRL